MTTSKQLEVWLYSFMAIGHFLLSAINTNAPLIMITQILGACFWVFMAINLLKVEV